MTFASPPPFPGAYELQPQDSEWCWAACLRMACSHWGISVDDQATLATRYTDKSNQALPSGEVPKVYADFGMDALEAVDPHNGNNLLHGLYNHGLSLIMLQLPGGYHFALVYAYDQAQNVFAVADPSPSIGQLIALPFSSIDQAYGLGGRLIEVWSISRAA